MKNRSDSQEVAKIVEGPVSTVYDSSEASITTGQTNYDIRANFTGAFVNVRKARACVIRSDQTVTVRFNSTSGPAITLDVSEGRLEISKEMGLEIGDIYITNASGNTAAIKILLFP